MNCRKIQENLVSYTKKEATSVSEDGIYQHLQQCQGCLHEHSAIQRHLQLYRYLPGIALTPNWSKLCKRIQQDQEKFEPVSRLVWKWRGWAIAAIIVLALCLVWQWMPGFHAHPWQMQILGYEGIKIHDNEFSTQTNALWCQLTPQITLLLGSHTKIQLQEPPYLELVQGSLLGKVNDHPLIIQTIHGQMRIQNTTFSVRTQPHSATLQVMEGVATFSSEQYGACSVKAGSQLFIQKSQFPQLANVTEPFPWWKEPFLLIGLGLEETASQSLLKITFTNIGSIPVQLPPLFQSTPQLALHIENDQDTYSKPCICSPCETTPILIGPGQNYQVICDISSLLVHNREQKLTVLYKGGCYCKEEADSCCKVNKEHHCPGPCCSPPLIIASRK